MGLRSRILERVPVADLRDLAEGLLEAGVPADEVATELAAMLDQLIDWRQILGGLPGVIVEQLDGPVLSAIARSIAALVVRGTTPYAPTVGVRPTVGAVEPSPSIGSIPRTVR